MIGSRRHSVEPAPRPGGPRAPPGQPRARRSAIPRLIAALRAERERQGLSLADLAERTGIDRAAIHKLEIGVNTNPTLATLSRYAGALVRGSSGISKPRRPSNPRRRDQRVEFASGRPPRTAHKEMMI